MGYLFVSIFVAATMSVSVYAATGSFLLAFLGYSAAGCLTLLSVLVADGLLRGDSLD